MTKNIDWKAEYDKLSTLVIGLCSKVSEINHAKDLILQMLSRNDQLSLLEQGKHKFYRTTMELSITPRYDCDSYHGSDGETRLSRVFDAGTLIDSPTVYLDDDGDGFLDFPADALEAVIISHDEVDWDKHVG